MRARGLRGCLLGCLAVVSACTYDPHPKDGAQECYKRSCVDGYVCGADNRCYAAGNVPAVGQGGVMQTGGLPKGAGGAGVGKGTGGLMGTAGRGGSTLGAGGTSGAGGATACQPGRASGLVPLVDDMADGDGAIPAQDGRVGGWFSFNDGMGVQTPTAPAVSTKIGWICTSGSGFDTWGAALAVSLDADESRSCTYDVTAYQGVRFAIQGMVAGGRIRFALNTSDIAAAASTVGGSCTPTTSARNDCDDTHGAWLTNTSFSGTTTVSCYNGISAPWACSSAPTSSSWATVSIPFSSMRQEGWGQAIALNLAHVIHLHWQSKIYYQDPTTGTTSNIGPTSFDFCIGNLTFY